MSNTINQNMFIEVKDYSVSGEVFQLIQNESYGFLETIPKPSIAKLPEYYQTEDYISHTDSKRNLFEKVYHSIREVSLKRKLKLINSFKTDQKKLLDFGCGTGDFLKSALNKGWNVSGIEPNSEARSIANSKTKQSVLDSEGIKTYKKHSFDVITLWHVLEHIPNLESQISILKDLLKPNGVLIIAVPNYKSYDANHYKQFWAAYDVPRHLWHFDKKSISKLFSSINMTIQNIKPMVFDSYYVSLLSEKYKNGSMNLFSAFWTGFRSNAKAKRSGEYSSLIYVLKNNK
ncbi:class I SAM-dependent methyltransferase [Olleya sp. YSTF-M6]|uniref:Class I SAM-dependent methyltransferase n=1 Tax=Olleya sediminilitoris TaxID=2795739 RepID=A0ABS1WHF5_9FLAO|nr:class I SAM-dependent methyltransferase [Olleya sediminilitoris]MBL7558488.1 class I SAM-dependent methyltransferase [Olleya sediminilitoris]